MQNFKIIALTHKNFEISEIGRFHIPEQEWSNRFSALKNNFGIKELMFLSTCNRVEFLLNTSANLNKEFLQKFIIYVYPEITQKELEKAISLAQIFENDQAIKHLFAVASSLDSLVIGEREIISQVRNAYEHSRRIGWTGDFLRIVIRKTIECAKEVYTLTNIARKPVSVVSLAYRKLKELRVKPDAKILIVGAGATNSTMGKYLKKHGLTNFTIFNRTLSNAEKLAAELGGRAFSLDKLKNYKEGFDVIVTCTASAAPVITNEIYTSLIKNDASKKIVVDLAVPSDLDSNISDKFNVHIIGISNLKTIAEQNLREREREIAECKKIITRHVEEFNRVFRERKVELVMSKVPKKVKEIRKTAVKKVFAKDIKKLDKESKEVLEKVISYLEKKYISVPMRMAKEILLEETSR